MTRVYNAEAPAKTLQAGAATLYPDDILAQRVKDTVTIPFHSTEGSTLQGRDISLSSSNTITNTPFGTPVDRTVLKALDAKLEGINNEPNYLTRVQILIAKLMEVYQQVSDEEKNEKKTIRDEYSILSNKSGNEEVTRGARSFNYTLIGLGINLVSLTGGLQLEGSRKIAEFLAGEGCRNLAGLFNADSMSNQKKYDAKTQLVMTKLNEIINNISGNSSSRDQLKQVLEQLFQVLREAARGG